MAQVADLLPGDGLEPREAVSTLQNVVKGRASLAKLGAERRTEAVMRGARLGLVLLEGLPHEDGATRVGDAP